MMKPQARSPVICLAKPRATLLIISPFKTTECCALLLTRAARCSGRSVALQIRCDFTFCVNLRKEHTGAPGDQAMTTQRLTVLGAAALVASTTAGYAGPCSAEIERMQARVEAKIEAAAAAGATAPEFRRSCSPPANTRRDCGRRARLGELSPQTVNAVREAMARAREVDRGGDLTTCEQALAEVQRTIGP